MALLRAKKGDLPADAIILNEDEARNYQVKVIHGWKNKSETFAFRYGGAILASFSAIAGIYINNHYRTRFKLMDYGRISSYLPIVALPAALSFLFHTELVAGDVALQKKCVVCTELRGSAIQGITGCLLPLILAPLSSFSFALKYNTYDVPYITSEPMKVFRLWQKQTRPIANILMGIFLGQAMLASVVTYFEAKSVQAVNRGLAKLEHDLEHNAKLP